MYFRRNSSFLSIDDVLSSTLAFYFVNASAPVCLPLQGPLASRRLRIFLFFHPSVLFSVLLLAQRLMSWLVGDFDLWVQVAALDFVRIKKVFGCFALSILQYYLLFF